jgi:hypothetical protein
MGKSPNSNLLIEIFALVILISYLIILFFIIVNTSKNSYLLIGSLENNETLVSKNLKTCFLCIKILTFILSIGLNIISVYILSSNNYILPGWIFLMIVLLFCIHLMIFMIERHFYKKTKYEHINNDPVRYCILAILALIPCSLALFFGTYSKYIHIRKKSITNDTIIQQIIWYLAIIDIIALCYCIGYIIYKGPFEGFYFGGEFGDQVNTLIKDLRNSGGYIINEGPFEHDPFEGFYFGGQYIVDLRNSGGFIL